MTVQDWYRRLVEDVIDAEKLLLAVMGLMSGFMLWGTTQFRSESAARFPRLTGSVVFIGAILLFFREYLPGPIRRVVVSEGAAFEASEEFAERQEDIEETQGEAEADPETEGFSTVDRPLHDSVFTAIAIVGYAVVGYAVGLLWATPLFVIGYARWFRVDLLRTVALTAIGFGIAYSFMIVLNVPMDAGAFFGGAPWLPR